MTMKAITFVSMLLLVISGGTAQSATAEPVNAAAAASFQPAQADLTTQRICMRCDPTR
jgi:cellobiose-specific phosphotransferase system component IIA